MKKNYQSQIYNAPRTFLYMVSFFAMALVILLLIAVKLKASLLAPIGFVCLCILPFFFEKRVKNIFTKRTFLEFDEQAFIVNEYHLKDDTLANKLVFKWVDIKSYKVYFTTQNLTYLTLYLKDGSNKIFGFKDNKTFEDAVKEESIFSIFYSYVKQFNADKKPDEKIALAPPFLTTSLGTSILFSVVGLSVFAICLHIFKAPKSSPFTLLMGVSIIITLLGKRKQDKDAYNRISNLS